MGGQPLFLFWIAQDPSALGDLKLRCTVDGAAIDDIPMSPEHAGRIEADTNPRTGKSLHYVWSHVEAHAEIFWGPDKNPIYSNPKRLADHPGKWDCMVRSNGKAIRELLFTVGADGMIAQDPIQSGKGASPTVDGVVAIDMRIPKDAGFDLRIRPDAIRKSRNFGLPWPEHPNAKAFLASLPPASGLPDPK